MVYSLGIMQGRLTPPEGRGIQFFPFNNWEKEFLIAAELGLNEIEFIFDFDNYEANPLYSPLSRARIISLVQQTGVKVNSICADYFMRRPFFRVEEDVRLENIRFLKKLIEVARQIGARTIEIPLVDNSSIKTVEEKNILISSLGEVVDLLKEYNIVLGLETDLQPQPFLALLQDINHPLIQANYDSGNSSGLGYEPYEEVVTLNKLIHNIHIKDRKFGGTTVSLGTGSANFDRLFQGLKEINYQGSFILQAARGVEGQEPETISNYIQFVKKYINKYLI